MMRYGTALAAIVLALGLSACGGGTSEFAAKAKEICEKQGGASQGDCGCQANLLDKELDDKSKKIFLVMMTVMEDPTKAEQAMKDAGITQADLQALGAKMGGLTEKMTKECKK